MYLAVTDIAAARAELVDRGVQVSEVFHLLPGQAPVAGGLGVAAKGDP